MKADEEIFILTGKASQRLKLDREQELGIFSLLNVANHNGITLGQLEIGIGYWNDFRSLRRFLESEICESLKCKFDDIEDEENGE